MSKLRRAVQRQNRAVQSEQYHHLFSCLIRNRFLFMRRVDIPKHVLKQLITCFMWNAPMVLKKHWSVFLNQYQGPLAHPYDKIHQIKDVRHLTHHPV